MSRMHDLLATEVPNMKIDITLVNCERPTIDIDSVRLGFVHVKLLAQESANERCFTCPTISNKDYLCLVQRERFSFDKLEVTPYRFTPPIDDLWRRGLEYIPLQKHHLLADFEKWELLFESSRGSNYRDEVCLDKPAR